MNGIYFKHFMQLFCNIHGADFKNIPILCAGITDNDPEKEEKPTKSNQVPGENAVLEVIDTINGSIYCRLYTNLKTFEYDLAMEGGNLNLLIDVYLGILETDGAIRQEWEIKANTKWGDEKDDDKKEVAYELLRRIENCKGEFAQALANRLSKDHPKFKVPQYIRDAIIWACNGDL